MDEFDKIAMDLVQAVNCGEDEIAAALRSVHNKAVDDVARLFEGYGGVVEATRLDGQVDYEKPSVIIRRLKKEASREDK